MSTFFESKSEKLIQVLQINATTQGVKYTVPSGRYAKVSINRATVASSSNVLTIGDIGIELANAFGSGTGVMANVYSDQLTTSLGVFLMAPAQGVTLGDIYIGAGEAIEVVFTTTIVLNITIFEYELP
jgi:hypothetical protein